MLFGQAEAGYVEGMLGTVLSLLVLAAVALVIGAFVLWRRGGALKQIGLMLLLAMVAIVNVLIWTLPDERGVAPIQRAQELHE